MRHEIEKLEIWRLSVLFAKDIYKLAQSFPAQEKYGLISQLTRASVSISSNIAEGKGRFHKKEFIQFLFLARGSCYECVSLITIAKELGHINNLESEKYVAELEEITAKLNSLIKYLKQSSVNGQL